MENAEDKLRFLRKVRCGSEVASRAPAIIEYDLNG
jgi:hypothetical protein